MLPRREKFLPPNLKRITCKHKQNYVIENLKAKLKSK